MIKGSHQTEEAKKKLSTSLKKHYNDPDNRLKQSIAHKGYKPTAEQNRKISEALKGRISPMLGRKHTEITKKKLSLSHIGRQTSPEARLNMSLARKGKPNGRKGIKLSEEHRKNISNANRGKKRSPEICEKMRLLGLGRKQSTETIAKRIATGRARGTIGMSGRTHTDDAKTKMSMAKKGKSTALKGRHLSEERKRQISIKLTGRKLTEEHIKNMSKGLKGVNTWMKGRTLSQQTRDNMSKAFTGRVFTEKHKNNLKAKWNDPEYVKKIANSKSKFSNNKNENRMKKILSSLDIQFETQKRINIPHTYLCDFYISSLNLVIETDGSFYHASPKRFNADDVIPLLGCTAKERWELDATRTKEMKEAGYKVLRFWEDEFDKESVKIKLLEMS